MGKPQDIVAFWVDEVGPKGWYQPTEALDQTIRDRFMGDWIAAPDRIAGWGDSAEGALAALILTDQFPRNMFREDARAFATDPMARALADHAIAAGFDVATPAPQRQFFYLPFEHSEDLADQDRALALFAGRMPGDSLIHAEWHRRTIAHFGRFPWRNAALGRVNTAEEQHVLDAGGYGALVSGRVSLAGPGQMV